MHGMMLFLECAIPLADAHDFVERILYLDDRKIFKWIFRLSFSFRFAQDLTYMKIH